LERELAGLKRKSSAADLAHLPQKAKPLSGSANGTGKFLAELIPGADAKTLRETADWARDQLKSGVVLLAISDEEKISFVVTVTPDCLAQGFHAGKIAQQFAKLINGSGGGRDSFAQGGGKARSDLKELLDQFKPV
jgi:alanyl-tRNA synthetase